MFGWILLAWLEYFAISLTVILAVSWLVIIHGRLIVGGVSFTIRRYDMRRWVVAAILESARLRVFGVLVEQVELTPQSQIELFRSWELGI